MKIVFLDTSTLGDVDLEPIRQVGDLTAYSITLPAERFDRLRGQDVAITNKVIIDSEIMDQCEGLRLICVAATGMNNIDVEYARTKGIRVMNVTDYSTRSVTQLTMAMILYFLNRPDYFDTWVKSGQYSRGMIFTYPGDCFRELASMRLGIIGLGHIGRSVAVAAQALGAEVCYYSTSGQNQTTDFTRLDLKELLSTCDIVSIHAPLNTKTRGLIGITELRLMKPSAFLLNMGRGGIVNEMELATALDGAGIAGAAIDVFEKEPLPAGHPFLHLKHPERIILSPHIAWAGMESKKILVAKIASNIRRFADDESKR